jgi:hypothetical protein
MTKIETSFENTASSPLTAAFLHSAYARSFHAPRGPSLAAPTLAFDLIGIKSLFVKITVLGTCGDKFWARHTPGARKRRKW